MSVLPYPPITQWGHPSASKRALCLHPMMGSSQIWLDIAASLVAQGYSVTAPDMLGHGLAPASTDYSIKALADALLPLLSATGPYDVMIASSLGTIVALTILPHLSGSCHVVLIDPPMEMSRDGLDMIAKMSIHEIMTPRTVDENVKERNYTKELAICWAAGRALCRISAVEGITQQNVPWSHTHLLPGPSTTHKITILAADPSVFAVFTQEEAAELKRTHPHIRTKMVKGAGHGMVLEVPYRDIIIEAALGNEGVDI